MNETTLTINGMIVPTDNADPTHEDSHCKGGYRSVETTDKLNELSAGQLKLGMLVHVRDTVGSGVLYKCIDIVDGVPTWSTSIATNVISSSDSIASFPDVVKDGDIDVPSYVLTEGQYDRVNTLVDNTAGSKTVDFFATTVEIEERDTYTPVATNVWNVLDTMAELTGVHPDDTFVSDGALYYVTEDRALYTPQNIPTTVALSLFGSPDIDGTYNRTVDVTGDIYWVKGAYNIKSAYPTDETDIADGVDIIWTIYNGTTPLIYNKTTFDDSGRQFPPITEEWFGFGGGSVTGKVTISSINWVPSEPLRLTNMTPTASSSGIAGQYTYDSNFRYDCILTGDPAQWVKSAITTVT